jgi:prepilin-type N-terminal cleavage/methylation domain-containing protein
MKDSRSAGFTLLELMMVVLVIALVLSVSYPSLSRGSTALHLRATGRDVLNIFRYAREKAVTEQTGMKITVDRQNQQLVLSDNLGDGKRSYAPPNDVKIERITLAGEEIVDGPMVVRFLPNGGSDSAEVLLRSRTGLFLRVLTDPITGGARIESGAGGN